MCPPTLRLEVGVRMLADQLDYVVGVDPPRDAQALVAAREGAVNARRAGLCQLRDLVITTPEPLRSQLRPLSTARLLQRLAASRPASRCDPELRGSLLALRSIARRVLQLTAEE